MEKKNTWRKIIEVFPDNINVALETLAMSMGLENDAFSKVDTSPLEDAKYVTAVPIELAFTSKERKIIIDKNPGIKYVITTVQPERVDDMVSSLDYELITLDDYLPIRFSEAGEYEEDIDEPVEIIDTDSYYQIGGMTVKGIHLYQLLEIDPKREQAGEDEALPEVKHPEDENEDVVVYKINGKEVSREEFLDSVPSFLKFFVG